MRDNLYEALDFFNLDDLFTWDDLQDVYKPMAKNNHPDVNGLSKEEYMKVINANKSVLQNYEMKNRTYLLKQLELKKQAFFEKLDDDKRKYNLSTVSDLVNTYKALLNGITGFNRLKKLKQEYNEKLSTILLNHEKQEKINLEHKKESVKKFFVYKYTKSSSSLNLDKCIEATKVLLSVLELIKKAGKDDIDDLIKKLDNITFSDFKSDLNIIDNISSSYTIYINKNTGSLVYVDSVGEVVKYRKSLSDKLASCSYKKFDQDYLSLERFLFESKYVGDRQVYMVSNLAVREDLPYSRYLYYHEQTGLMLVYKEIEVIENFIFYGENKRDLFGDFSTYFKITSIKREDVLRGKFRDREYLFQKIMEQTSKVDHVKMSEEIKKNGIDMGIMKKSSR